MCRVFLSLSSGRPHCVTCSPALIIAFFSVVRTSTRHADSIELYEMATEWQTALAWLRGGTFGGLFALFGRTTTAAEAEQFTRYFEKNPQQLQVADSYRRLPLHCVARYTRGQHALKLVTYLLAKYPKGAGQTTYDGDLPLHWAAQHQKGEHAVAIVTAVLKAYPDGARQKDEGGYLPADRAQRNADLSPACVAMLRQAAQSPCQVPPIGTMANAPGIGFYPSVFFLVLQVFSFFFAVSMLLLSFQFFGYVLVSFSVSPVCLSLFF